MKIERNNKCPCGSGKKYKKCCRLDTAKNAEMNRAAFIAKTWDELIEILSKPIQVYRLKIVLTRMGFNEIKEEVSRTIEVEENHTLYDLHLDIQRAFNWDNAHMFSFYTGGILFDREHEYSGNPSGEHIVSGMGKPSKSAGTTQIRDLVLTKNSTILYLFDYGDELIHEITVEEVNDKNDEDMKLPNTVNASGTPPPQYDEFD